MTWNLHENFMGTFRLKFPLMRMKGCIVVWIERRIMCTLHALLIWSTALWAPLVDELNFLQSTLYPLIYSLQAWKRGTFVSCRVLLTNRAGLYDIQWALIFWVHLGASREKYSQCSFCLLLLIFYLHSIHFQGEGVQHLTLKIF